MSDDMDVMDTAAFRIIAEVGTARSKYVAAIEAAEKGDFEGAEKLLEDGRQDYIKGHDAHGELIALMASGQLPAADLLLVHAEDQLMSAENFRVIAEKFISLYRRLDAE